MKGMLVGYTFSEGAGGTCYDVVNQVNSVFDNTYSPLWRGGKLLFNQNRNNIHNLEMINYINNIGKGTIAYAYTRTNDGDANSYEYAFYSTYYAVFANYRDPNGTTSYFRYNTTVIDWSSIDPFISDLYGTHSFACRWDESLSNANVIVNGLRSASNTISTGIATTSRVEIGGRSSSDARFLNGIMHYFYYYEDRIEDEVARLLALDPYAPFRVKKSIYVPVSDTIQEDVAGSLPAMNGITVPALRAKRSLAGSLPATNGAVIGKLSALRALVGNLPAMSGSLISKMLAKRSLSGSLPSMSGTSLGSSLFKGVLAGVLPAMNGVVVGIRRFPRTILGSLPAMAGSLVARLRAKRNLSGSLPEMTGYVNTAEMLEDVAGVLENFVGAGVGKLRAKRSLSGSLSATGVITRKLSLGRSLSGELPAMSGSLNSDTAQSFSGVLSFSGGLSRRLLLNRSVAGTI